MRTVLCLIDSLKQTSAFGVVAFRVSVAIGNQSLKSLAQSRHEESKEVD
jgi:hypothetical protein